MCAGKGSQGNTGGANLVMRDVVSNCFQNTKVLCSTPAAISCSCSRKAVHSGARTLLTSPPFVANAAESLLFDSYIKLVKELHNRSIFGGCMCLRTGYLIPTYLIENHQSHFKVCSETVSGCLLMALERGARFAQSSNPSC